MKEIIICKLCGLLVVVSMQMNFSSVVLFPDFSKNFQQNFPKTFAPACNFTKKNNP